MYKPNKSEKSFKHYNLYIIYVIHVIDRGQYVFYEGHIKNSLKADISQKAEVGKRGVGRTPGRQKYLKKKRCPLYLRIRLYDISFSSLFSLTWTAPRDEA